MPSIADKKHAHSESAFDRFKSLLRGLVAVPKKEVEIEEARWRADRLKKKKSAV
jgi:hypothetical protein